MRASFKWLNDYLQLNNTGEIAVLAQKLNETLTEVDGIEEMLPPFQGVYVGKILKVENHPNADNLHVTTVTIGKEQNLQIVCSAKNLYEGMIVPVTIPGSILYDEEGNAFEVKQTKLRGVESEGMMCSERELHVGRDHTGILDLTHNKGLTLGELLDPYFADQVLNIENKAITHRPDCFSHIGIAQEIAAISTQKPVSYVHIQQESIGFESKHVTGAEHQHILENKMFSLPNDITLQIAGYTRRYSTITIKGIKIQNSPVELQERILAMGHRPINNIVDLTNYVMFDIGQPLHAFDLDFTGNHFAIRTGKKGEKIVTLDGVEHVLTDEDITITDGQKPLDIGGIIGGLDSGIQPHTRNIALVADNFDPSMLRKTSWRHGIRTDAVTIYEKNIDPNLTILGLAEFVHLYKTYFPQDEIEVSTILDYYPNPLPETKEIDLTYTNIANLIGIEIPKEEIRKILTSIHIEIISEKGDNLSLRVPSRRTDLNIKEDVIEEIVRLYGYAKLPVRQYYYKLHEVKMYPGREEIITAKTFLADQGFFEIEPYSFSNEEEEAQLGLTGPQVHIKNALNSQDNIMKSSILPDLIKAVSLNARFSDTCKLQVFSRVFEETKEGQLPKESKYIGGALYTRGKNEELIADEYYKGKALVLGLLTALRIDTKDVAFEKAGAQEVNDKIFISDKTLHITYKGKRIGTYGLTSGNVQRIYDISSPFILFEFIWDEVYKAIDRSYELKSYSRFPAIQQDISFYLDQNMPISDIIAAIKEARPKHMVDIQTIDEYRDKEKRSATIRITFNDIQKTLTSAVVEKEINRIKESLTEKYPETVTLR